MDVGEYLAGGGMAGAERDRLGPDAVCCEWGGHDGVVYADEACSVGDIGGGFEFGRESGRFRAVGRLDIECPHGSDACARDGRGVCSSCCSITVT